MKKKGYKKYFIKDEALHNDSDKDMFNYTDMAEVFKRIIENTDPPYNVAVIGKWGLGKSSLIHLVTDAYKKQNGKYDEYLVQEINAWKYEKESLRKVFLKQLWQALSGKKIKSFDIIRKEYERIIYGDFDEFNQETNKKSKDQPKKTPWERIKSWFITMWPMVRTGLIILAGTYLAMYFYKCIQFNLDGETFMKYFFTGDFHGKVFMSYCRNVATIWILPLLVTFGAKALDDYRAKKEKKIELNFPLESVDDYEIFLETKIQEHMTAHENLKIITIIDDLDRLSIEKIVEALDALKAFVGFERCIFIVPFDDEIIKDALEKRRKVHIRDEEKNDIVESELILDKLFQFKLYLPPLLQFDIQKYAINLMKQEAPDFLEDYCDEETMTDLLKEIIIHPDVTTPRQVKKLMNAFINNALLAFEREKSGKVGNQLLTSKEGLQQIAKLSVLQADFNHFYDTLLIDMGSIDEILQYNDSIDTLETDLPNHLIKYFEPIKDNQNNVQYMAIKREYEPLINFLSGTKKYRVDSLAPYIYLAQDDISRKTGDETQRRVVNAMQSGNTKTVMAMLEQNPDVAAAVDYYLSAPGEEKKEALRVSIAVYHVIAEAYQAQLSQHIIRRAMEIEDDAFFYDLPVENYISIAMQNKNVQFGEQFMDKYVAVLTNEDCYNQKSFGEAVENLIAHHADLTQQQSASLQSAIKMALKLSQTVVTEFVPVVCVDNEELFRIYWGLPWVEKLCAYMEIEGDFEDTIVENLKKSFCALQNQFLDEMVKYIIPLAEYTQFLPVLNDMLDGKMENAPRGTVRSAIGKDRATGLANAAISCGYENAKSEIFKVLNGLEYEVTEENQEQFDNFATNFVRTAAMDDVLVYCGQKGYFVFLDKTMASLVEVMFENDENDQLLAKIQMYLTEEQKNDLITRLKTESEKIANASAMYERVLRIYAILAEDNGHAEELDNLVSTSLIPKFDANYTKAEYCNFISQAIGYVRHLLQTATVDKFVGVLIKRFANYRHQYLQMLNRLSGYISTEQFEELFPIITQAVPQSELADTLRLIKDNDKCRPRDSHNLKVYRDFLVSHVEEAEDPDVILRTINDSFGRITDVPQLLKAALANEKCDSKLLAEVVRKFWNAINSEAGYQEAAEALVSHIVENYAIISEILAGVNADITRSILERVDEQLDDNTSVEVLLGLVRLVRELHMAEYELEMLKHALELALSHQNQLEAVTKLLKAIGECGEQVSKEKDAFAQILAQGFSSTTSENLKDGILRTVAQLKIKMQFRRLLEGEDLAYYKRWKN